MIGTKANPVAKAVIKIGVKRSAEPEHQFGPKRLVLDQLQIAIMALRA